MAEETTLSIVEKIDVPSGVYQNLRQQASLDNTSVNYQSAKAIQELYGAALPTGDAAAWSSALEARAAAQRTAVRELRDALDERWIRERDFRGALKLSHYQFVSLAHVLAGVADADEEQALPSSLRCIIAYMKEKR